MKSEYLTDDEYQTYWFRLEGIRKDISENLGLHAGMEVLDVGTGWGLFAIEMAKQLKKGKIIGIDIVDDGITNARKLVQKAEVAHVVSIAKMDAVKLGFPDNSFNLATCFLGMRDIYMTRGRKGVRKAVEEMIRIIKPSATIILCITPPEDMVTEDQRIAVELEGEIFGAKSLPKKFYIDIFKENNAALSETRAYFTNKKMTSDQTKTEVKDGIKIARKIYRRKVPQFKQVWEKYGKKIETFGYGMYSKIVTLEANKLSKRTIFNS